MSWKNINDRLKSLEPGGDTQAGAQFVGRYYDELTDEEKEKYFDYLYGTERKFDHKTHEYFLEVVWGEDWQKKTHYKCEAREFDPRKKVSKTELERREKEVEKIFNEI